MNNKDIEIKDFYEYINRVIKKACEIWVAGEGDLNIEVRDDKGQKRAKIKGGAVDRIGGLRIEDEKN